MSEEGWPTEWMRGVLSLCVLAVVAEDETYGYAIAQRLNRAGLGTVKGGSLYPVLTRLEQEGLLTSSWREGVGGPGRKFFAATPAGRAALRERRSAWLAFTHQITGLIASEGGPRDDRHTDLQQAAAARIAPTRAVGPPDRRSPRLGAKPRS